MIDVILLERVDRLGSLGDVVKVRPGFARNYLLPQKKALRATKNNITVFEARKAELAAKNDAQKADAEKAAKKLSGLSLVLIRQASDTGQLYGSVTARDVSEAAAEKKVTIARSIIEINKQIKTIGIYQVQVKLHPDVIAEVEIRVARNLEEAQKLTNAPAAAAAAPEAKPAAELAAPASPEAESDAAPAKAKKTKKPKKEADAA